VSSVDNVKVPEHEDDNTEKEADQTNIKQIQHSPDTNIVPTTGQL